MSILSSLPDYFRAIQTASHYQGLSLAEATASVARAKINYGIGPRFHSLFELGSKPEASWGDYLIDEPLKTHLRRVNPSDARNVVNDKLLFFSHCRAAEIPTIPLVLSIDHNKPSPCPRDLLANTEDDWKRLIEFAPNEIFFKLINGSWGQDAFSAKRLGSTWHYCGERGSASDLYRFCLQRLKGRRGWIVQPRLHPHPSLQTIMSQHALGTIRMVTMQESGVPSLLSSVLRIPVGKNIADNFVHGSSGNLIAAIDANSGVLLPARGSRSEKWPQIKNLEDHPETGNRITGMELPFWDEAQRLVVDAHGTLPRLITLGWDIAITAAGPVVVEANATYDVDLIQIALQHGLRPSLKNIFL